MLKSFTLKNFKSFKEATLQLTPTVTFLIGANGSGKSNALEALRFLAFLGEGGSLEAFDYYSYDEDALVRGASKDLLRYGEKSFELSCFIKTNTKSFIWNSTIGKSSETDRGRNRTLILEKEELLDCASNNTIFDFPIAKSLADETIIRFAKENSTRKGHALFQDLNSLSGIILSGNTDKQISANNNDNLHILNEYTKELKIHFSNIIFLTPEALQMRKYANNFGSKKILESGKNLSDVLWSLCAEPRTKKEIIKFVESLPEQMIKDISFSTTDEDFVMLRLTESCGQKEHIVPAYLLSDGTLRALAIAAALYGAPEGSLIVIEEVDNGIHPSRIKHLVDKMYEIAVERKIQILVTTHDPAMMDAIPPQEKANVLCCYRSKEDGTSKILRIADSPHCDFIVSGHTLGDFVKTELYETTLNDTRTAEEVHKEQSDWLNVFLSNIDAIRAQEAKHE